MGRIRTLLAASILLLSGQVNAQIISSATLLEGAELWNYSVEGSVTDDQGSSSDIFGAMLIDTTARSWLYPPHAPWDGQYTATNFFHIVGFGLRIGDQNYFGGGPFINGGENSNVNALYLGDNLSVVDYPNDSGCGGCDWGFMPFGRDEIWSSGGQTFGFGYADGSPFTVSDLARGVAPIISRSTLVTSWMGLIRKISSRPGFP